jgi:pilus assembly protein TadC
MLEGLVVPISKRRRAAAIEAELPSALRAVAAGLDSGVGFEACLASAARDYGAASPEFGRVLSEVENGASMPEALEAMAGRVGSLFAGRAAAALALAYRSGDSACLRPLAAEQDAVARARLREYSGKLTVYMLLFIAASAIVPAMFQAFVIVGSSILSMPVTPLAALLIPALAFPAIDAAILAFAYARRPL